MNRVKASGEPAGEGWPVLVPAVDALRLPPPSVARAYRYEPVALVDLLDRVLAGGVVVSGDVRLSIAGVDLVTISLHALISSVTAAGSGGGEEVSHGPTPPGS